MPNPFHVQAENVFSKWRSALSGCHVLNRTYREQTWRLAAVSCNAVGAGVWHGAPTLCAAAMVAPHADQEARGAVLGCLQASSTATQPMWHDVPKLS